MAKGSNDNATRPRQNNSPSQQDNHICDYHSLSSASTSTPNDPDGTVTIHCSGTQGSFNNYGEGSQDFSDATINSGTRSIVVANRTDTCSGTIGSFNNRGRGPQDFQAAKINSGCNSTVTAPQSPNRFPRIARILNIGKSGQKFIREQDRVLHCSGTLHSFNNNGNGSQTFNAANINSAANSEDL